MERHILHLRVPDFPVAVYQVKDPSLRGRPVIVSGGRGPRAMVLSVSGLAAGDGVRRGMTLPEALRRCRAARVLPSDPVLFDRADRALVSLLGRFSPLVEPGRGGRLFADLSGTGRLFGRAADTARRIQKEVERALRLAPSAGLGANKLVSGVAARVLTPPPKAMSLMDVAPGQEADFLSPLPVGHLPAVSHDMEGRLLDELNIRRVCDLARIALPHLRIAFGDRGTTLYRQARGIDASPVRPPDRTPCVEADVTLAEDTSDDEALLGEALGLVESCGTRLRRLRQAAGRLRLTARYADGVLSSRQALLSPPVSGDLTLFHRLQEIFDAVLARRGRVRYLRVRLDRLAPASGQGCLFDARELRREGDLVAALDRIRQRFGGGVIRFGRRA
ncbi:MAG: DNA polymerase Y family protein [Candidatus Polarisedimenticolia bacterium]